MDAKLITRLPETTLDDVLSPVEELYTQKTTELHVQVIKIRRMTGKNSPNELDTQKTTGLHLSQSHGIVITR